MRTALTVVGLQWGDEGKGKIVDWLAAEAGHVARFQGGHNAGHTLVVGNQKIVLHLLPSGVLHRGASCYLGPGVVVSPAALLEEIDEVEAAGVSVEGRLFVAAGAALVLPYHIMLDKRRNASLGTTMRGIGPAHEDKVARRALRIYDLYNGEGEKTLAANAALYSEMLDEKIDPAPIWQDLQKHANRIRPFIADDVGARLHAAVQRKERVLLEGAQAVLLDIEHGTYPYVTSAACLPSAAASGIGAELSPDSLGVSKAYATRVGSGPFPTELKDDPCGEKLARLGDEVGATTGRPRRCGWLDIPMLRHAILVSGCRRIALTKLDVLDGFKEIPICVEYEMDGRILKTPPADPHDLSRCQPRWETLPGWSDATVGATDESALPSGARSYIDRITELAGVSIDIISTGAARESNIIRRHPFGEKP